MNLTRWSIVLLLLATGCRQHSGNSSSERAQPATQEAADGAPDRFPGQKHRQAFESLAARYEASIRANEIDASAHAGRSEMYSTLWCFGFGSRREVLPAARAAATRAVELDDQLAAAHTAMGIVTLCDWDWETAEREFRRAIELDPDDAKAHHWLALYLAAMGRHEEALVASTRAESLDPDSLGFKVGKGAVLYFGRAFEEMRRQMLGVVALDPDFPWGYDWLGMAQVQLRQFEPAIETYQKAVRLSDGTAEVVAGLGHAYGVAGREAEASRILDQLESLAGRWYIPPVQRAYVCVGLGRWDRAFELLEEAFRDRSWELVFLREEPWLDEIREDARFAALEKRMRFP